MSDEIITWTTGTEADLKKADKAIQRAQEKLKKAQMDRAQILSGRLLLCPTCDERHPISAWVFIQDYWYRQPYGCTGGDSWHLSDINYARCPCGGVLRLWAPEGHPVRLLNNDRMLFHSVEKCHTDIKYMQYNIR